MHNNNANNHTQHTHNNDDALLLRHSSGQHALSDRLGTFVI